jgi:hypothetical protein
MSTAMDLDLDLGLLVGEMPAEPCESTSHDPADMLAHDDGPAVSYVRMTCPVCAHSVIKAYCQQFINFLFGGGNVQHSEACGAFPGVEWATVLGPVGSAK